MAVGFRRATGIISASCLVPEINILHRPRITRYCRLSSRLTNLLTFAHSPHTGCPVTKGVSCRKKKKKKKTNEICSFSRKSSFCKFIERKLEFG